MWHRALVVGALVALVATACGDDDDDAASGDSGTNSADTATTGAANPDTGDAGEEAGARGVSATSIRVGGLGQTDFFPGMEAGARARFERSNAEGGVNGRTVDYIGFQDDGSDASANLDLARQLVENDEVFAIIPATSAVMLPATTDYLNAERTPAIGWGFMPGFCVEGGYVYSFNGCLSGLAFGVENPVNNSALVEPTGLFLDNPDYTVAIANSDDDAGRGGSAQYNQLLGDRVVHEAFIPTSGVTDYSPYVNEILASEPDAVMVACDFACTLAVKAALTGAGYEGLMWDFSTYIPGLLGDPAVAGALEGTFTNSQFPPQEGGGAFIEQVLADLEVIGEAPFVTQGVAIGYVAADMFLEMVAAAGPDLTAESLHDVVAAGFTYDHLDEGGMGPISYPDGYSQPAPCSALVKVEGGEYIVEIPFACYEVVPAT